MIEQLFYSFVVRGIIAAVLLGFIGGAIGTFVVQRRMSFLGDGLAHAVFGGIAISLFMRFEPFLIAVPFTILVALLLTYLKEKTPIEYDTAIGVLFAVSVAIGVLFISLNKFYISDAFSYFFGSILLISKNDIIVLIALAFAIVILFKFFWSRWSYSSFDGELARSDKVPVVVDNYILSVLIALVILISVKLVGILLVVSFIVLPSATAKVVSKTFSQMTIISALLGIFSAFTGVVIAVLFNIPVGSTIVLFQAFLFLIAIIVGKIIK